MGMGRTGSIEHEGASTGQYPLSMIVDDNSSKRANDAISRVNERNSTIRHA